jgi:hypothetical protein
MEKIARADVFVVLDDVQFTKNGFQNRNKIKHPQGWMYLTVPVKHRSGQLLHEVEIGDVKGWCQHHWHLIEANYGRAPYFQNYKDDLERIYAQPWHRLNDLNWKLLSFLCSALAISTPLVRSSELGLTEKATDRLIEMCRAVGATRYYTGSYSLDAYLNVAAMNEAGIEVVPQDWSCPEYRQAFPQAGFIPDLSAIDLLLNEGPASPATLRAGGG